MQSFSDVMQDDQNELQRFLKERYELPIEAANVVLYEQRPGPMDYSARRWIEWDIITENVSGQVTLGPHYNGRPVYRDTIRIERQHFRKDLPE